MTEAPLVAVKALRSVVMVVADLDRTARFYAGALDFEPLGRKPITDRGWLRLFGLEDRRVDRMRMRLGATEVAFLAPDPPGRPYPAGSTASDLWFQHIAIVVADMAAAFARVQSATPISRHGPAQLPPSAGGVQAFKFRDPDGHPLELLSFGADVPDRWRHPDAGRLFRGIDHSAIAVADTERSGRFYRQVLGLSPGPASLNRGPAQTALDDVASDIVAVVPLSPLEPTPHVELLGYRAGSRRAVPADAGPADIAATRLILSTRDPAPLQALAPLVPLQHGSGGLALTDPDGHRLIVIRAHRERPEAQIGDSLAKI